MESYQLTITQRDEHLPLYLCSVGHVHQAATHYPNGHPHFHWLHTISGTGTVRFMNETRTLYPGTGFLMYPKMECAYWPSHEPWEVAWLTFNGHNVADFLHAWGMPPGFIKLVDLPHVMDIVQRLLSRAGERAHYTGAILSAQLYAFIIELGWQASRDEQLSQRRRRLLPALQFVQQHYAQPVGVDDMAAAVGVTPQHLGRLFRSIYGTTPMNYVTTYRITQAKELLLNEPALTVAQVGARTGFSSTSYFCTVFRRFEKTTPTEFRRLNTPAV